VESPADGRGHPELTGCDHDDPPNQVLQVFFGEAQPTMDGTQRGRGLGGVS
jgi:hypothetical protein